MPNKDIMDKVLLNHPEWPMVLTPEQREQLLQDKIARVLQAIDIRRKYPSNIREELNIVCCNAKQCEHI